MRAWNWIGKWLNRRRNAYKVVHRQTGGQLVSAVIRGEFERVYRRRDGYCPLVRQAIAFESLALAVRFASLRSDCQVWLARCESARRLQSLCSVAASFKTLRCFSRQWGEPNGWGQGLQAPAGTLLCKNLRLVRKVD